MRAFWIAVTMAGLAGPVAAEGDQAPVAAPAGPGAKAAAPAPDVPKGAPSPATPSSSERFVFVPSGIDRTINFVSQLQPDCASLGTTEYRIQVKPEHGTVTFQQGENFPSYPMGNPMQHCNDKKGPGLFTHYTSTDGYVGEDHADVLYLLQSATAIVVRYTIIVK